MTSTTPIQLAPDRANTRLADLVNTALELQNEEGTQSAVALLTDAGASFATISRVLCDASRRRADR
jgi:hypothetical protein